MWILRLKGLKIAKTVYEKEIDVTYPSKRQDITT